MNEPPPAVLRNQIELADRMHQHQHQVLQNNVNNGHRANVAPSNLGFTVLYTAVSSLGLALSIASSLTALQLQKSHASKTIGGSSSEALEITWLELLVFFFRSRVNTVMSLNAVFNICHIVYGAVRYLVFGAINHNERRVVHRESRNYFLRMLFVSLMVGANVQDLAVWNGWFAIVCVPSTLATLAGERFNSISTQLPERETSRIEVIRYLLFNVVLFVWNAGLTLAAAYLFLEAGLLVLCVLLYENLAMVFQCLQTICKLIILLSALRPRNGAEPPQGDDLAHAQWADREAAAAWEHRSSYLYYVEFAGETGKDLFAMLHIVYMWSCLSWRLTLVHLALFIYSRTVFLRLYGQLLGFYQFRAAIHDMRTNFPDATAAELAAVVDDKCAICRDAMHSAKKLPCGHLFHKWCLHQWLKHRRICPVCRHPLNGSERPPQQNRGRAPQINSTHTHSHNSNNNTGSAAPNGVINQAAVPSSGPNNGPAPPIAPSETPSAVSRKADPAHHPDSNNGSGDNGHSSSAPSNPPASSDGLRHRSSHYVATVASPAPVSASTSASTPSNSSRSAQGHAQSAAQDTVVHRGKSGHPLVLSALSTVQLAGSSPRSVAVGSSPRHPLPNGSLPSSLTRSTSLPNTSPRRVSSPPVLSGEMADRYSPRRIPSVDATAASPSFSEAQLNSVFQFTPTNGAAPAPARTSAARRHRHSSGSIGSNSPSAIHTRKVVPAFSSSAFSSAFADPSAPSEPISATAVAAALLAQRSLLSNSSSPRVGLAPTLSRSVSTPIDSELPSTPHSPSLFDFRPSDPSSFASGSVPSVPIAHPSSVPSSSNVTSSSAAFPTLSSSAAVSTVSSSSPSLSAPTNTTAAPSSVSASQNQQHGDRPNPVLNLNDMSPLPPSAVSFHQPSPSNAGVPSDLDAMESLFRFNSHEWSSWLPSFSLEILRSAGPPRVPETHTHGSDRVLLRPLSQGPSASGHSVPARSTSSSAPPTHQ